MNKDAIATHSNSIRSDNPTLFLIVERLVAVLPVHSIFSYPMQTSLSGAFQQLCVVIQSGTGIGLLEARALCTRLLEGRTNYRGLVISTSDLNEKNRHGSIRTALICHPDHLIYQSPDFAGNLNTSVSDYEDLYKKSTNYFKTEFTRIGAFEEGFRFYLRKGKREQASFMLHQTLELGFRTAACLIIGKEKITHSLKNHQVYLLPYYPALGQLFSTPDELILLGKLDESYKATRYDHHFSLTVVELIAASAKADRLMHELQELHQMLLADLRRMIPAENTRKPTGKATLSDARISDRSAQGYLRGAGSNSQISAKIC